MAQKARVGSGAADFRELPAPMIVDEFRQRRLIQLVQDIAERLVVGAAFCKLRSV